MSRGLRAAIIGGGLGNLGPGRAVFVMVKRTGAVLAALPARFGGRLPAGTSSHSALRQGEHTDDRRHPS